MKAAELQGSGQGENGTFDIGSGYTGFSGGLPMLLGPCVDIGKYSDAGRDWGQEEKGKTG